MHILFVLVSPGSVETDVWELEEPFDGQLCQECCAKNRQNPFILLNVTIDNVGVPFY